MFTITNTRIVGLIAVVCAVIAAPQVLAASSTHSRFAPPGDPSGFDLNDLKNGRALTAATPDAALGYDLTGFDLSDLNNIPGYQQQREYLDGLKSAALAGGAQKKSQREPAPEPAVKTAPVVCIDQAEYDYVYSGCEWWS